MHPLLLLKLLTYTAERNSDLQKSYNFDQTMKQCLDLSGLCLHSYLSISLSPSHKSAIHTCVSLPPPLSRPVHSFGPPPLAFIRTVDGESRTSPLHKSTYGHIRTPYVRVNIYYIYRLSRCWFYSICEGTKDGPTSCCC